MLAAVGSRMVQEPHDSRYFEDSVRLFHSYFQLLSVPDFCWWLMVEMFFRQLLFQESQISYYDHWGRFLEKTLPASLPNQTT
jgi:hypothetical protein